MLTHAELVDAAIMRGSRHGLFQEPQEFRQFLRWLLDRQPTPPLHIIEIGTLHGGTAAAFAALAQGRVVTVDLPNGPFGGKDHQYTPTRAMRRNHELASMYPNLFPWLGSSQDPATREAVSRILQGSLVDLLFIDGDHTYEGAMADYRNWSPLVRPGGVVAFHDINPDAPMHGPGSGVDVPRLWKDLTALHANAREWVQPGAKCGGIGALIV